MEKPHTFYLKPLTEDHKFVELRIYFPEDATDALLEGVVKQLFPACNQSCKETGITIAQIAIYKGDQVREYRELLLESERNEINVPLPKAQTVIEDPETGKRITVEKDKVSATYAGIEQFKVGETQGELHDSLYDQASMHVKAIACLAEIKAGELLVQGIPENQSALEQLFNEVNEKEFGGQLRFKWILKK